VLYSPLCTIHDYEPISVNPSHIIEHIVGNATKGTELVFTYGTDIRDRPQLIQLGSSVTFQVQIEYRLLDGTHLTRHITKCQRVTTDREEAETKANISLLGVEMIRECAMLARKGEYSKSLRHLNSKRKHIQQIAHTQDSKIVAKILYKASLLERHIHEARELERNKEHKVREKYRSQRERSLSRERSRSPSYRSLRIAFRNNSFAKDIFSGQYITSQDFIKVINQSKYSSIKTYQTVKSPKRSKHSSKRKRKRSSSHDKSKRRKRSRDRKDGDRKDGDRKDVEVKKERREDENRS